MNKEFKMGVRAFMLGHRLSENPFEPETEQFKAWEDGWIRALTDFDDDYMFFSEDDEPEEELPC